MLRVGSIVLSLVLGGLIKDSQKLEDQGVAASSRR